MATITIHHDDFLLCRAEHHASGVELTTDVAKDKLGGGTSFDPTDLLGTSLGACIISTIALSAMSRGIDITGARAEVDYEMIEDPKRRIGRIVVNLGLPETYDKKTQKLFAVAARTCPVHNTLATNTDIEINFSYPEE